MRPALHQQSGKNMTQTHSDQKATYMLYSIFSALKSSRFSEKAKQILRLCLISATFLNFNLVHAKTTSTLQFVDSQSIQQQIQNYIHELMEAAAMDTTEIEIVPNKISKTLKLPSCKQPLSLSREGNKSIYGRNTVKVSCSSPKWSFYSGASVKAFGTILTAAMPIAKGEVITKSHIQATRIDRAKISGNTLTNPSLILGMAAKRPIRQGKMLTSYQFEQPKLIERGDGVVIQAIGKSMTVSTAGEALSQGRLGENIRVRNLKSDREIIAKVKNKDTVVVMLY